METSDTLIETIIKSVEADGKHQVHSNMITMAAVSRLKKSGFKVKMSGDGLLTVTKKQKASKKLPKVLERDQIKKFMACPNTKTKIGLRNRAILQVLYRAGLRVSEICNLTEPDINLKNGFIYVQLGKGSKDRWLPLDSETVNWLKKWAAIRPQNTDLFFPTLKGTKLDQRYIRDLFYRISKQTGVYIQDGHRKKPVHPHAFRHTCLTELLEEDFNITEVQAIAGHSSIQTTAIYLSVRPAKLAEKMRNRPTTESEATV